MAPLALLLLGGNVGDRLARLRRAMEDLQSLPGARIRARSRVYETAPVGPSERPYLNAVVALETTLSPMGLLVEAKKMEVEAGRKAGKKWSARPIDVDILAYGSVRLKTPWLTIPHPLMHQRPFVLAPLADVAPHYRLRGGNTVASALRRLKPPSSIVRMYPHGL
jgi:2-amino-4-hydroxy-6-hydroxymethyldihydropteridine diphosphokinase